MKKENDEENIRYDIEEACKHYVSTWGETESIRKYDATWASPSGRAD